MGDWMSFLEEDLSSRRGPLLASLSAFWLRLSEKASSLEGERRYRKSLLGAWWEISATLNQILRIIVTMVLIGYLIDVPIFLDGDHFVKKKGLRAGQEMRLGRLGDYRQGSIHCSCDHKQEVGSRLLTDPGPRYTGGVSDRPPHCAGLPTSPPTLGGRGAGTPLF